MPRWPGARQPQRAQRGEADPVGDRRPAARARRRRSRPRSAGGGWWSCSRTTASSPHLVHPSQCKAIASARLKNNKVDAAILAQLLRADLLPEAWVAPPEVRQLRALLRHRVAAGPAADAAAQPDPRRAGRPRPRPAAGCWSGPGREWLASLPLPAVSGGGDLGRPGADRRPGGPDRPARLRDPPARQVRPAGQGADPAARGSGRSPRWSSLAEIGDVSRFASARKLASWAGLTPTVRGSNRVAQLRAHLQAGLGRGCGGCCARRRRPPSAPRSSPPATRPSPGGGARRSPPPRSPASCSLVPGTCSPTPGSRCRNPPPRPRRKPSAGDRPEGVARPRASSQISLSRPRRARRTD